MKFFLKLLIFLVAITVLSAWTFRLEMDTIYRGADASNMIEEFQAYGLNQTTMIVVGIFKVMCAIFLLLGLKFEKFVTPAPTNNPLSLSGNIGPLPPLLSISPTSFSNLQNTGNGTKTIAVTVTQQTGVWVASVQYIDGFGWINGVNINFQTGDGNITFTVDAGYTGGGSFSQQARQANINITNITNPSQLALTCVVTQFYNVQGGGGGFVS